MFACMLEGIMKVEDAVTSKREREVGEQGTNMFLCK